jgi:hypothetical protein
MWRLPLTVFSHGVSFGHLIRIERQPNRPMFCGRVLPLIKESQREASRTSKVAICFLLVLVLSVTRRLGCTKIARHVLEGHSHYNGVPMMSRRRGTFRHPNPRGLPNGKRTQRDWRRAKVGSLCSLELEILPSSVVPKLCTTDQRCSEPATCWAALAASLTWGYSPVLRFPASCATPLLRETQVVLGPEDG